MYCNRCGKQIAIGTICNECLQENKRPVYTPPQSTAANYNRPEAYETRSAYGYGYGLPEPNNRMYGFGKALTSTILSQIGFVFVYIALIVGAVEPGAGIVLSFMSLPLIIIPIVFGIASIQLFKERKGTCAKPIPALVLGIVGLSTAGLAALFDFIAFVVAVSLS